MKNSTIERVSIENVKVRKVCNNTFSETDDELAVEEPLEIQLVYRENEKHIKKNISVTMRTPGNDKELAAGFLFTEGIIHNRKQISEISLYPGDDNKVSVALNEGEVPFLQKAERNFYTTSSCGVCGKSSIDAINTVSVYKNTELKICLKADLFYGLPEALRKNQKIFSSTGGLHASALFDLKGNFQMLQEDVGRHNALDKLIGAAFLNDKLPLTETILLLSGRASFELIQKSVMAGIKIIASVGAPSSLAVKLAKDNQITLIGFLRDERFNIYSGEERIMIS